MREAVFVKTNYPKWKSFEAVMQKNKAATPDELAELFVQLTDDLAFARTHYPESDITRYLNNLAAGVHQRIYRNKKEDLGRFVSFWTRELPLLFREARRPLLYSFLIFIISVGIGILSSEYDTTYARLILGDGYVNMTLENIEKGDPMAVYKDEEMLSMFAAIAFNNLRVALTIFAAGLVLSVGAGLILFYNGVMVGAFQYFFLQKGLFWTSFLTIWVHGTLEMASFIIAGAAGLVVGNSFLFPGTYPRIESFKRGAQKGLKMLIGVLPIIVVAAVLESYITRFTDWHWSIKAVIILTSALFMLYYFVIYPSQLERKEDAGAVH
ncbi:membrane protein [Flammeovirgaceae bacterium 311]|nr:membrane protein [Flammeovirgaceae bacterium 311]